MTFSLTISNTFKVQSSEPESSLLMSQVNDKDRISLWWGLKDTSLFFFAKLAIQRSPLLLPAASRLESLEAVREAKNISPASNFFVDSFVSVLQNQICPNYPHVTISSPTNANFQALMTGTSIVTAYSRIKLCSTCFKRPNFDHRIHRCCCELFRVV